MCFDGGDFETNLGRGWKKNQNRNMDSKADTETNEQTETACRPSMIISIETCSKSDHNERDCRSQLLIMIKIKFWWMFHHHHHHSDVVEEEKNLILK